MAKPRKSEEDQEDRKSEEARKSEEDQEDRKSEEDLSELELARKRERNRIAGADLPEREVARLGT